MRKINLLVLLLLSTVTSIFASNQTYDWIQMTQYITYDAQGNEASRMEYTYDTEGRETGYKYFSNGTLSQQYRDYQYNGRTITCWGDTYTSGSVSSSVKLQRTYTDINWIQIAQQIQYAANGTEASRMECTYDTEGRESSYKYFLNGKLYSQNRDYQYNGRSITYWYDMYIGGSIVSGKIQRTYSDLNWIQITQQIQYAANGTEASRTEYTYDTEGRETGYKSFGIGPVSYQYRDYQYNGQTITCWVDTYKSGSLSVSSSSKIQRTYREAETKTSKTGTDVQTACGSFTWIDGKTYTASNNSASHKLVAKNGNDSIVTLNLTINDKPAVIASLQNGSLVASTSNDTYQWLNCNANSTAIVNATAQTFSPTQTGNYAVKVSSKGCEATSACVTFEAQTTGLADKNQLTFSIYPNPSQGVFNIAGLPTGTYKILNLMGAEVFQFNVESTDAQLLNLSHLAKGLYQISTEDLKIMHNKVVITD
jgi:hypothetical protein